MNFADAVTKHNDNEVARTENGMRARKTTAKKVLDLFGKIGSARGVDLSKQFFGALAQDEDLTLRVLLWARDVRGGSGERQTFRTLLSALEDASPALAGKVMPKIPELGRWDDLLVYKEPVNRVAALTMISNALVNAHEHVYGSTSADMLMRDLPMHVRKAIATGALAAKWMPRKGLVAVELTKFMGLTPRQYRKMLVALTNVVETKMCAKDWEEINFSEVPSLAAARYQRAFMRNAPEAYSKYARELEKPEDERDPSVKINAGAVYPHDVVKSTYTGNKTVADAQWKALPNYVGDAKIFPMVDVSGSMGWLGSGYSYDTGPQPIEVAVALGLYLSEKNTGDFKDLFLTFSATPKIVSLKGTLSQRIAQMSGADWGMNTNLHAAFGHMLKVATKGKVSQDDMPEYLLILSDMQFDHCVAHDDSAIKMIKRKYKDAGYKMPKVIFWNLNGAYDNVPVKFDKSGTAMVSGFSPALMKAVLSADLEDFTPWNVMLETIMVDRYNLD